MSINGAMLAGVSVLTANAAALSTISQNIANVNTVGYKRTAAEFSTVVNSQSQGTGYSAGGVQTSTRNYISQGGQLQRTVSSTDLGISGQGFFVTAQKAEGLDASDARLFTRAGAFQVDDFGYLKNTAGLYLQGWPVDAQGVITTDPSDLGRLRSINVGSVGGTAEPTTRAQMNGNLNSDVVPSTAATLFATTPADAAAYNPATRSMAQWTPGGTAGVKPDFTMTMPISDSKGGQRTISIHFLKSAVANQWHAEVVADPDEVEVGSSLSNGQIKTGLVAFTADGKLDIAAMAAMPAGTALFTSASGTLDFGASTAPGATPSALGTNGFRWAESLGISAQTISLDIGGGNSSGGITQASRDSYVESVITNGTAFGAMTKIEIDTEGFVTAIFDNGITRRIAQVALATFPSPDSLTSVTGNAFAVSQGSGTYNLKAAGTGGAGLIAPSQLEASTVDLSAEFTGLITTQRAYSASSKIITTADEMLAELINIKR